MVGEVRRENADGTPKTTPPIHEQADLAAEAKANEERAERKKEWPSWYSEDKFGEKAYIECGREGTAVIGLMHFGSARFAAEDKTTNLQATDAALGDVVQQWPEAWGPIPSEIPEEEDRVAAYDKIPGKWISRMADGAKILSGN